MITTSNGLAAETSDAELVAESLAGDREAFRQIVERHKTLVCSIAYCATGSLSQSEDLAQETFLAAWRQLAELRDPSRLRPWLCGIARFVIGKELRRQGRDPVHEAATLDEVSELEGTEALPSDRAISKEEQAILWRCVASVPKIYREPLVLFYREHQSIERVAEALELTEDAVKQRLARGRRMLQEKATAYVEGALRSTNPGHEFTFGVLAALPLSATSAKTLTLGAALKGSSTFKTFAALAAVGAVILYYSLLGFLAFAGACTGYWMSRACARSPGQCHNVIRFWRILARTFVGCVIIRELLAPGFLFAACPWIRHWVPFYLFPGWYSGKGLLVARLVLDIPLAVIIAAHADLVWRWSRELEGKAFQTQEAFPVLKTHLKRWVLLGMIVPALWFISTVGNALGQKLRPPRHLSHAELQSIVSTRKDAYYQGHEDSGAKTLEVVLPENNPGSIKWRLDHMPDWWKRWTRGAGPSWWNLWIGNSVPYGLVWTMYSVGWRPVQMVAPADAWSLKLLDDAGIHFDYGRVDRTRGDTWPFWRWMPLFILPMGITILSRRNAPQSTSNALPNSERLTMENQTGGMGLSIHSDPNARRVFCIAFGTAFALAFTANAMTAFGVYVLLLVGALKGTFFGLIAGIGVLYLRSKFKVRTESRD